MDYLILDTEATDKYPETAEVLEVAIIDHTGAVLLNERVRPVRAKSWPRAQEIHGIAPGDVLRAGVPTLAELNPRIADVIRGREVVIYNSAYDATILAEAFALGPPAAVHCAMLSFSEHPEVRTWNDYHGNWRWVGLASAAAHVGHFWQGQHHSALADCHAARDVWAWLTDPVERERLAAVKLQREAEAEIAWHVRDLTEPAQRAEQERLRRVGWAWERDHYPAMGVRYRSEYQYCDEARKSADAFALHLVGTTAQAWNRWGHLLQLPRHYRLADNVPAGLVRSHEVHLLPAAKRIKPAAVLVYGPDDSAPHEWLDVHPLYNKRSLRKGVHYVPILPGYEPWPEGHYSKTTLQKQFKLKPAEIEAMRPACLRVVRHGDRYENQYLLYAYTPPTA